MKIAIAGRGIGGTSGVAAVEVFADLIGAKLGVSRPVSADGWASHDHIVGISGASVKAELALLFGVSGATAFLAGISRSRFIIGINKAPNTPVFKTCDVGLVGDYKAVLNRLNELILSKKACEIKAE
ncbi:FAD-binding protein [Lachnospiraceae bacterium ZAX-1]